MQDQPTSAAFDRLFDAQERRGKAWEGGDVSGQITAARDCELAHFELDQRRLAKALFNEDIQLIEESGECRELLPELFGMTGRALQRMKHWDEALETYTRAAREAAVQGLAEQRLRWGGKEARTRLDLGDSKAAIAQLEASIEFGRSLLRDDRDVCEELSQHIIHLAHSLLEHESERAEALWREANEIVKQIEPCPTHFMAAVNYATYLARKKRFYLARTYLEEAFEIGRQVGVSEAQMHNLSIRLAHLLHEMREQERAGDYLMDQCIAADDLRTKHQILTQAVACYFDGNLWGKMKDACAELRELRKLGATHEGMCEVEMWYSIACRELGEKGEALASLESALGYARAWGDPEAIMKALGQTAIMLVAHGDYSEAVKTGLELWEQGLRQPLAARTLVKALIGTDELDRAIQIRDEFAESGGGELDVAFLDAYLADAGHGDPIKAWYDVGVAADLDRAVEAEVLSRLSELYPCGSEDRFEVARARLRLIDSARTQVSDVFSESSWQAFTPLAKHFPSYLDDFIEEAIALQRDEETIYELERFRSQMLVNVMSERSNLWSGKEPDSFWLKGCFVNDYQRAHYHFAGLVAREASWQVRRKAAEAVDQAKSLASRPPILVAPGFQGFHFPQNLQEHLEGISLAKDEVLVFQHLLSDRTAIWTTDHLGQTARTEIPSFCAKDAARLHDVLRHGRPDGIVVRGKKRDVVQAEQDHYLDRVLSELEGGLARPLVSWLRQLTGRRRAGGSTLHLPGSLPSASLDGHCAGLRARNTGP